MNMVTAMEKIIKQDLGSLRQDLKEKSCTLLNFPKVVVRAGAFSFRADVDKKRVLLSELDSISRYPAFWRYVPPILEETHRQVEEWPDKPFSSKPVVLAPPPSAPVKSPRWTDWSTTREAANTFINEIEKVFRDIPGFTGFTGGNSIAHAFWFKFRGRERWVTVKLDGRRVGDVDLRLDWHWKLRHLIRACAGERSEWWWGRGARPQEADVAWALKNMPAFCGALLTAAQEAAKELSMAINGEAEQVLREDLGDLLTELYVEERATEQRPAHPHF